VLDGIIQRRMKPDPATYLGAGKFQRRDFQYQDLTKRAAFGEDTLFGSMDMAEIFAPDTSFPPVTVAEIAERGAQPA